MGPARGPLWTSPSGHEYLSLLWEEAGRQRCLLFMEGTSLFRLASDTAAVVDEWAMIIQDAVRASGLNPTLLVKKGTQVVPASPWLALLVLLPLLLVFLFVFRTNWGGSLLVMVLGIGAPLLFRQRRVTLGAFPAPAPTVVHPAGVADAVPNTTGPAAALGFRSASAARWLLLSHLGFLGFLGSVPGWERMWGFTGFFGFAGVATLSEFMHRQAKTSGPLRGWRKAILTTVTAMVIALPLRASVIQTFVLRGNSAAPELPAGSWVLVWKLSQSFAVGDMVVYKEGDLAFAGRLVKLGKEYLVVQRNGTGDLTVSRDLVIGKVIAQTRAAAHSEPAAPLPPKSASSAAAPPSLAPLSEQALTAWIIEGKVLGWDGKPVPEAEVKVSLGSTPFATLGTGKTQRDGSYHITFGASAARAPQDLRGVLQPVLIRVEKKEYAEKDLCQAGELQMAWELTPEQKAGGVPSGLDRVLLPGRPLHTDFVLLPAATVRGVLLNPDGSPLPDRGITLVGNRMPPGKSIYATASADRNGRFVFDDVSTQHDWSFSVDDDPRFTKRTAPRRFSVPGYHEVSFILDGDHLQPLPSVQKDLFAEFCAAPEMKEGTFTVWFKRIHYFGDDVPDANDKSAFEASSGPSFAKKSLVFVPNHYQVADKMAQAVGWDKPGVAATVELRWATDGGAREWIELTNLVKLGWH